jgi:hypothetical protein
MTLSMTQPPRPWPGVAMPIGAEHAGMSGTGLAGPVLG